jgi:16S rRNA (cytidine1402-2'-O)-methyltransferase
MSSDETISSAIHPGLWLVATPIGNLEDLSPRGAAVLRASSMICCEDTRHSGSLLKRIGASPERLVVTNEHTEHDAIETVLTALASAIAAGHTVHSTPGPVAFVMAAAMSGLPTARIAFDGFLPRSGAERRERLTEVARERRTTVLYEAPHRLERTLSDLAEVCGGDRPVVLAREMTKLHEEMWRGTMAEAVLHAQAVEPRGEYALVIGPAVFESIDITDDEIVNELSKRLASGFTKRDAIDEVTAALGLPRKRVYTLATQK